ncbi:MAG: ATP-binding protein [Burkholderiales bacterium]
MKEELKRIQSAVAHDLNNYLQVIMGNLEVLKRRREFTPEVVDAALAGTRSAAFLADRLLALGRLESYEPRALDLNRFLRELTEMLERTVGDSVALEFELAADLRDVRADPRALQLALLELATNAREAMASGGRLMLRTAQAPAERVLLELVDNGRGMPRNARGTFEPLNVAARPGKPRALGLHLVEYCMRAGGGRMELDSAPGTGTRVKLYLPAA